MLIFLSTVPGALVRIKRPKARRHTLVGVKRLRFVLRVLCASRGESGCQLTTTEVLWPQECQLASMKVSSGQTYNK